MGGVSQSVERIVAMIAWSLAIVWIGLRLVIGCELSDFLEPFLLFAGYAYAHLVSFSAHGVGILAPFDVVHKPKQKRGSLA